MPSADLSLQTSGCNHQGGLVTITSTPRALPTNGYLIDSPPRIRLAEPGARFVSRGMKTVNLLSLLAIVTLACSSAALADSAKTYQVTGPVLEMNDSMIAVQKGKDRWEINRDSSSKVPTEVKVGDKVTITYTMTAKEVEMKPAKAAKEKK